MKISYKTQGVCSTYINLEVEDGIVRHVQFYGGCNGNLKGISQLVKGKSYKEIIDTLNGITCNGKPTSCPDQLCRAIEQLMAEE